VKNRASQRNQKRRYSTVVVKTDTPCAQQGLLRGTVTKRSIKKSRLWRNKAISKGCQQGVWATSPQSSASDKGKKKVPKMGNSGAKEKEWQDERNREGPFNAKGGMPEDFVGDMNSGVR